MSRKSEFELAVKVSIGQFIPAESLIHQLDPRVKLLIGILLIGTTIMISSFVSLLGLFLAVISGLLLARIQLGMAFKVLKPVLPFLFILALIQVFAVPQLREGALVIWKLGILQVTDRSLLAGILLIGRFVVIVLGLSLFSFSTSSTEFMHGIEHLLRPLQKLKIPAHELALVINISIRFLPILVSETERLMKAQASRGADFGQGKGLNFIRRIRRMLPLFVPMFIISLKHAQRLIEAMESRCYIGGRDRTHLIHLHAESLDYVVFTIFLGLATAILIMNFFHIDYALWGWIRS